MPADKVTKDLETSDKLEISKRSLGLLKGNAYDALDKYRDTSDSKMKAANAKCDAQKALAETAKDKYEAVRDLICGPSCTVLPGLVGTNPACIPCKTSSSSLKTIYSALDKKAKACELVGLTGIKSWIVANKLGLWIAQYAVKVA
jgi:hypothetical protein